MQHIHRGDVNLIPLPAEGVYGNDCASDDQIVSIFLSKYEHSRYTHRNYSRAIDQFRRFIGTKLLSQVTWREIEAFKLALGRGALGESGRPQSTATVAMYLSALRSFFKWGSDANIGFFSVNPMSCVKSPKVRISSRGHYLTKDELSRLFCELNKRDKRDYLIGVTLVLLGLRVSEVVNIRREDFYKDPAGVSTWLNVTRGKGDKPRHVKVPNLLWAMYQNHWETHGYPRDPDALVFPLTVRQVERIIQRARDGAGLEKKVTPHWLRHTNATLALLFGASLQQVQDSLGHAQVNTTQRYLHTIDLVKKAAPDYVEDGLYDIIKYASTNP